MYYTMYIFYAGSIFCKCLETLESLSLNMMSMIRFVIIVIDMSVEKTPAQGEVLLFGNGHVAITCIRPHQRSPVSGIP